jgi:anaerobic selenocysteine-containing dehydrogenase
VGLGTSFGRGASSTLPGDLQNSDLIVLEGSNMAEAHPVAFQWVMEAKARGATVIHVDPHYSRTSALADMFVPLRAGTDIAFLGAIINHVVSNDADFREYVLAYTNAPSVRSSRTSAPTVCSRDSTPRSARMTRRAGSTRTRSSLRRPASATRRATSRH